LFFLFVKIKITIVFEKKIAILVIKIRNFIVSTTLDSLKFNKSNLNIEFRNRNSKEKAFLKNF